MSNLAVQLAKLCFDKENYLDNVLQYTVDDTDENRMLFSLLGNVNDEVQTIIKLDALFTDTYRGCMLICREFYEVPEDKENIAFMACNTINKDLQLFRLYYDSSSGYIVAEADIYARMDEQYKYIRTFINSFIITRDSINEYLDDMLG